MTSYLPDSDDIIIRIPMTLSSKEDVKLDVMEMTIIERRQEELIWL